MTYLIVNLTIYLLTLLGALSSSWKGQFKAEPFNIFMVMLFTVMSAWTVSLMVKLP